MPKKQKKRSNECPEGSASGENYEAPFKNNSSNEGRGSVQDENKKEIASAKNKIKDGEEKHAREAHLKKKKPMDPESPPLRSKPNGLNPVESVDGLVTSIPDMANMDAFTESQSRPSLMADGSVVRPSKGKKAKKSKSSSQNKAIDDDQPGSRLSKEDIQLMEKCFSVERHGKPKDVLGHDRAGQQ